MNWLQWGISLAGLSIVLGAFGAHGLKGVISSELLNVFEKAVYYQGFHGLGLILLSLTKNKLNKSINLVGRLFLVGIILFSGSLYGLVLTDQRWLGMITPIGGSCLIAGWATWFWKSK